MNIKALLEILDFMMPNISEIISKFFISLFKYFGISWTQLSFTLILFVYIFSLIHIS